MMMISTALAKGMLDANPLNLLLDGFLLHIYEGSMPDSADAALGSATLLSTISLEDSGAGMSFESNAVSNVLQKNSSEVWEGTNLATGTATFCRLVLESDTGAATTSEVRIQGDVGIAGRFLNLSSILLTAGAVQSVDNLAIAFPLK